MRCGQRRHSLSQLPAGPCVSPVLGAPGQVPEGGRSLQGPGPGVCLTPARPDCQQSVSNSTTRLWRRGMLRAGSGHRLKMLIPKKSGSCKATGETAAARPLASTVGKLDAVFLFSVGWARGAGRRARSRGRQKAAAIRTPPLSEPIPCSPGGVNGGSPGGSATGTANTCCGG